MTSEFSQYLQATAIIDYKSDIVADFVEKNISDSDSLREKAVKLYLATRDDVRYDPYTVDLSAAGFRASDVLKRRRAWCAPKSALLVACCRGIGIPARLGFADVINHISTRRMRESMKTNIFHWHGYASIFLDGAWLKATPAFNKELCDRFGLKPLDFDGRADALLQEFDSMGNKYMEYILYRGEFADVPVELIRKTFEREYADFLLNQSAHFDSDVEKEFKS